MREEFEKLRRAVVAGEVGAVIVYRVCRLSRDAPELQELLRELDGLDVEERFDDDTTEDDVSA